MDEAIVNIIKDKLADKDQRLLYLALSGSHAWGLSRPDSDLDFRGIYIDSTVREFDIYSHKDTVEFSEGIYDVQLYELGKFLRMLCKHNGNMVNLLWLPHPLINTLSIPFAGLSRWFLTKS